MVTQEQLQALFYYDKKEGVWWESLGSACIGLKPPLGEKVGTTNEEGYTEIDVLGEMHTTDQLAWLYMTSTEMSKEVSCKHVNGVSSDNRWSNLRYTAYEEE